MFTVYYLNFHCVCVFVCVCIRYVYVCVLYVCGEVGWDMHTCHRLQQNT